MNGETLAALALLEAGMDRRHIEHGLTLLGVDTSSTPEEVTSVVDRLRGDLPTLFASSAGGARPSAPPAPRSNVIPIDRGEGTPAERARKRFADTQRPLGPTAAPEAETGHQRTSPRGGGAA